MDFLMDKIRVCCEKLDSWREKEVCAVKDILYTECGYKSAKMPMDGIMWNAFDANTPLKAGDRHYWFKFSLHTPPENEGHVLRLKLTEYTRWFKASTNPQGMVYLNGVWYGKKS